MILWVIKLGASERPLNNKDAQQKHAPDGVNGGGANRGKFSGATGDAGRWAPQNSNILNKKYYEETI